MPGSLAIATLATCALFATATGIVGAVVTLMGLLAFPAMLRPGYDVKLAAGVVCAGGCLGILIPPSIMLILYGATAGVSVVKLYAAAFLPGLMLTGLYMFYVMLIALLPNPALAPPPPPEKMRNVPCAAVFHASSHAPSCRWRPDPLGARRDPVRPCDTVRGGRDGRPGRPHPRGRLSRAHLEKLKESVFLTARTTAMVCWLFVGSFIFSSVFGFSAARAWSRIS